MFGDIGGEFRERVKRLRLLRRWDQATLADRAGTSTTIVSQIETGRLTPSAEQIAAIARALGYSPAFLTTQWSVAATRPWLRAYADASKREADARTAAVITAAEYIRRLGLNPLPDLIPPFAGDVENDDDIEEAACELRELAQIDCDGVVTNAIRAAERLGCVVLPLESELGRHLGMSMRADQIPMICVAKWHVPGDRQRHTIAHELGHLAIHSRRPPPRNAEEASGMEKEANRFAAAFLGPGDALIETLGQAGGTVTLRALADVKSVWGISIKSLVGRYHTLGIIDADHARSLYKQISARKWSKDEPVHVPTESAQWFPRTLLRKAGVDDLNAASELLASAAGGNPKDLYGFANWTHASEGRLLHMVGRERRPT